MCGLTKKVPVLIALASAVLFIAPLSAQNTTATQSVTLESAAQLGAAAKKATTSVASLSAFFKANRLPWTPTILTFGKFTYGETKIPSAFSIYLQELLTLALLENQNTIKLVHSDIFESLDPSFKAAWGTNANTDSVNAAVSATFSEETAGSRAVRVKVTLTDLLTNTIKAVGVFTIPGADIPPGVQIKPPDLDQAIAMGLTLQEYADALAKNQAQKPASFNIRASLNTPTGIYRPNDEMTLSVYASANVYLKIYYTDVTKATVLLFPNQYNKDNLVRAGSMVSIPGPDYEGFKLRMLPPAGTEFIRIVASKTQFKDIEPALQAIEGLTLRRIEVQGTPNTQELREIRLNYTIVE